MLRISNNTQGTVLTAIEARMFCTVSATLFKYYSHVRVNVKQAKWWGIKIHQGLPLRLWGESSRWKILWQQYIIWHGGLQLLMRLLNCSLCYLPWNPESGTHFFRLMWFLISSLIQVKSQYWFLQMNDASKHLLSCLSVSQWAAIGTAPTDWQTYC